jgi:ABC-type multidrug transport system ATPase subunit
MPLELEDVSFTIPTREGERTLLQGISLRLPKQHLCAIVGPSGCGKSTLLKVIAGLYEGGGTIRWKGRDLAREQDLPPGEIGYVPQFSIAHEYLSVIENVESAVRLRVNCRGGEEFDARVDKALAQTGLTELADRRVKVLSGGQRRRLGLALELVSQPSLLLCDEVTSGLDPRSEDEVVRLMRRLADVETDRIVLTVTHSLSHLDLYDSVLVLHEGAVAFHGAPRDLADYFGTANAEEIYPMLGKRSVEEWRALWARKAGQHREGILAGRPGRTHSPAALEDEEHLRLSRVDYGRPAAQQATVEFSEDAAQPPGALTQFGELFARRVRIFFRDPAQVWLQLALLIGFPLVVAIFALDGLPQMANLNMDISQNPLNLLKETVKFNVDAMNVGKLVSGLAMLQVVLLTLMASNNGAREIAAERPILEKEKFAGVRPGAYILAKATFALILATLQSGWMLMFVKIACSLPGDPIAQFGQLWMATAAMSCVCLGISACTRSAEQASLLSIYLVGFQLPLSGALLALPDVLEKITQPFIAAYWGWSGYLHTLKSTTFYDGVLLITETTLAEASLSYLILGIHILLGLSLAYAGARKNMWEN